MRCGRPLAFGCQSVGSRSYSFRNSRLRIRLPEYAALRAKPLVKRRVKLISRPCVVCLPSGRFEKLSRVVLRVRSAEQAVAAARWWS